MMNSKKLYSIALSFVGTPHINGAMVKGAGVDCCTLPALIYKEMELADIKIAFGYSADWFCAKECKEILFPYLEKYFTPATDLRVGDLISYSWGRAKYAHTALYLGDNKCVHCQADVGVEITDISNPYFIKPNGQSRMTGIWRLK